MTFLELDRKYFFFALKWTINIYYLPGNFIKKTACKEDLIPPKRYFFLLCVAAIRDYESASEHSENDRQIKEGLEKAQRLLKQSQKRDYYKILGVKRCKRAKICPQINMLQRQCDVIEVVLMFTQQDGPEEGDHQSIQKTGPTVAPGQLPGPRRKEGSWEEVHRHCSGQGGLNQPG